MKGLPKMPIGFNGKLKHENEGVAKFLMHKMRHMPNECTKENYLFLFIEAMMVRIFTIMINRDCKSQQGTNILHTRCRNNLTIDTYSSNIHLHVWSQDQQGVEKLFSLGTFSMISRQQSLSLKNQIFFGAMVSGKTFTKHHWQT